ncbi:uncharacterized protein [Maniola hyperantus]|uniref:uncharacterized protein n=1 Tax=Aphantopus hyperantus TaxID=2795564 RepID=UPI00211FB0C6
MNNKDKKRKNKKNTRKVILQYKDTKETLVLTRAVRKRRENLIIKIQCNTQSVKEVSRTVTQNEDYPIFRAQLKDRIVPRCLRDRCRRQVQHKTKQCQLHRGRKSKDKSKSHNAKNRTAIIPLITISDDESDGLQYDDISSGSSWTDYEIDALMVSTRKRMKDSDEEWKLCPRQRNLINKKLLKQITTVQPSRSPSPNYLDTLVLEAMELEDMPEQKLNTAAFETEHDRVKRRLTHEPRQSLKRKERFEINEDEHPSQLNTAAYSKTANPQKKIKLKALENKNKAKHRRDSYESKLPKEDPLKKEQSTHQQDETVNKPEPPETNNNIISQPNYLPRDQKSIVNDTTNNEIDAVITKLENDMNYSVLNLNLIDIKQELYSDI